MERDDDLLRAFVARGDRAALGTLVVRHQDAVYDLARRIARDPALAEDAAQEAFMRLLRSARDYRPVTTFRAWLLRLTRNATLDLLRARNRRAGHEHAAGLAAAAGTGSEPASAPAERAELRRAVAALPDALRLAVELHVFRGLSHAEAGEVLECPAGTIASRIHRAKDELRARLAGFGAGVAALLDASDALAEAPPPAPPALAARLAEWATRADAPPPPPDPALPVPAFAVGAAALLAVGLGAWVLLGPRADLALSPRDVPTAASAGADAAGVSRPPADAPPVAFSTPSTAGAPHPPAPPLADAVALRAEDETGQPGLGALVVRVVAPDGTPVAGARVALRRDPDSPIDPEWIADDVRRVRAVTGTDGRARLLVPFGGVFDETEESIRVRAAGYAPGTLAGQTIRAGEERETEVVRLAAGRTIPGRVVDEEGLPVAGLAVWAEAHEEGGPLSVLADGDINPQTPYFWQLPAGWAPPEAARTGRNGEFLLRDVPSEMVRVVVLVGPVATIREVVPANRVLPVEIVLPERRPLHARATGPTPLPAGLRVTVIVGDDGHTVRYLALPADGALDLGLVPLGGVRITIADPAQAWSGHASVDAWATDTPVEIPLARVPAPVEPDDLRAIVTDAGSGEPLPRFTIALERLGDGPFSDLPPWASEIRSGRGEIRLDDLEPGPYRLWVRTRGRPGVPTPFTIEDGRRLAPIRIQVPRTAVALRGLVRTSDGAPVVGAIVTPFAHPRRVGGAVWREVPLHSSVRTGADGTFTIRFLPPSPLSLHVRGEACGLGDAHLPAVRPGGDPVEIVLARAGGLRVTVVDAHGRPAPGARGILQALPSPAGGDGDTTGFLTDAAGRLELVPLPPGTYRVALRRADGTPVPECSTTVEVRSGAVVPIDFRLPPGGRIRGQLRDAPPDLAGWGIVLRAREDDGFGPTPLAARLDAGGGFWLEDVPAGEYVVVLTDPEGGRHAAGPVVVRSGEETAFAGAWPSPAPAGPAPAARPAKTEGKVVGVSDKYNLVMLDMGEGDGVRSGDTFRIERDGQPIARLKIDKVFPDMCAATTAETFERGKVQQGDRAIPERR